MMVDNYTKAEQAAANSSALDITESFNRYASGHDANDCTKNENDEAQARRPGYNQHGVVSWRPLSHEQQP